MNSTDPYNHPFPKKEQTMYLSTITNNDFKPSYLKITRDSSFQKRDIEGANPRIRIPTKPHDSFSLSTFIEPTPQNAKRVNKVSDSLYRDDIEGARPKANEFRTTRTVDPLCPVYKLPSAADISVDPGRKFIRDTLQTTDITQRGKQFMEGRGREVLKQPIIGSQPAKLTRLVQAQSNLEVTDINKDGFFESTRRVDPLNPTYKWRQEPDKEPTNYGPIPGATPKRMHPQHINPNRPQNSCLNISDIEGAKTNTCFAKSHFLDKRRQFRDYMNTSDIENAQSSTLKKGINTKRSVNPLMPSYRLPGHSQVQKQ